MAKATVICTCGSEFRVEKVCRNRREADSFTVWAENHVDSCRTCKAAARQQEHAAAAAEQSEKDAAIGIAPLQGSEKQVVWATQIRGKAMTVHGALMATIRDNLTDSDVAYLTHMNVRWMEALSNTAAAWWIENRRDLGDPVGLINYLAEGFVDPGTT